MAEIDDCSIERYEICYDGGLGYEMLIWSNVPFCLLIHNFRPVFNALSRLHYYIPLCLTEYPQPNPRHNTQSTTRADMIQIAYTARMDTNVLASPFSYFLYSIHHCPLHILIFIRVTCSEKGWNGASSI